MRKKSTVARSNSLPAAATVLRKLGLEGDNPGAFCGEWLGSDKLLSSVSPINR